MINALKVLQVWIQLHPTGLHLSRDHSASFAFFTVLRRSPCLNFAFKRNVTIIKAKQWGLEREGEEHNNEFCYYYDIERIRKAELKAKNCNTTSKELVAGWAKKTTTEIQRK